MTTATKYVSVQDIQAFEEKAKTYAKKATVTYGAMAIGDWHAQGDVMIERIKELPEKSEKMQLKNDDTARQLAPGDTRGSRHMIKESDFSKVELYKVAESDDLTGPVMFIKEGPVEVEHPDHGHVVLKTPGYYQIRYQRLYNAADEALRRVRD